MWTALYRGATDLAGPIVPLILDRRTAAGKEDPARRAERLGCPTVTRPAGPLCWVHAASVGEALSVQTVVRRLLARFPACTVLMTTGTVTSARLMGERLPAGAIHQYVPLDRLSYVRSFLDHWSPDLVIWVESEIWPNHLAELKRRGVPAVLVNARMSERSFRNWKRAPGLVRDLLSAFELVLPWNEQGADRLRALGIDRLGPTGNLKLASEPLAADGATLEAMRQAIGDRPVWLAASTHPGEEEICAVVHRELAQRFRRLLTIVAPRHPARGPALAERLLPEYGPAPRRAAGDMPTAETALYVADTMGEMGLLLRLAPVVFVGGSLVEHGGHNPNEAAQLDCAILYGPHMTNFPEMTRQLEGAGAARMVGDGAELAAALARLLSDPEAAAGQARRARAVAESNRGVIDQVMAALEPLLNRTLAGGAGGQAA